MGILSAISGIFRGIGGVVGKIFGSKEQRDKDASEEVQLSKEIMLAEYRASANRRDFFTVFVDGLNRLVRPTFSYGIIAFFAWVVVDPVQFTVSMQALALVPDFMYGIFLTIIGFWFGGRIVEKYADARLQIPSDSQLRQVLEKQKEILERTERREREVEDHIITAATIASPNSVIVDVVNNKPRKIVTMNPVYDDDEKPVPIEEVIENIQQAEKNNRE
jgi:hypothetical protein